MLTTTIFLFVLFFGALALVANYRFYRKSKKVNETSSSPPLSERGAPLNPPTREEDKSQEMF
jgi:hypothetical protein